MATGTGLLWLRTGRIVSGIDGQSELARANRVALSRDPVQLIFRRIVAGHTEFGIMLRTHRADPALAMFTNAFVLITRVRCLE